VPRPHWTPGIIAARRRRELFTSFLVLFLLNLLVWLVRPEWSARLGALVVSAVVFPVVHLAVSRG
jgi:hypothetical protein